MNDPAGLPRTAAPVEPAADRSTGAVDCGVPEASDVAAVAERIVLIEFRWLGAAGIQPVLYLERVLLH